ncbi:adenylyl-sulfate kinase [Paenibacillus xylaniclasticus]|uniref:adenylyl-sulfate kinase n=1 Tax=Paenibacillus xylaniclasticus TaxID=588083 RepID=UPI000FDB305B|nr:MULTISPECIES: adenylyl-sulfate kinase [Paenibacillus]GFN30754.1 adenylyl-sulfate kinase [Paenibacillus curdlanolyticus]
MGRAGTVYWITGLSGSGKTTIGSLLRDRLKERGRSVVLLDGDALREAFGNDLGYTEEERRRSAMRNARLCLLLSEQGIDVVCATISMFHACREWNRQHMEFYREIYLRVSLDTLIKRNQKGLYFEALNGGNQEVAGITMVIEEPREPHLVVDNEGGLTPEQIVSQILELDLESC